MDADPHDEFGFTPAILEAANGELRVELNTEIPGYSDLWFKDSNLGTVPNYDVGMVHAVLSKFIAALSKSGS